jgi:hypothetical protein
VEAVQLTCQKLAQVTRAKTQEARETLELLVGGASRALCPALTVGRGARILTGLLSAATGVRGVRVTRGDGLRRTFWCVPGV